MTVQLGFGGLDLQQVMDSILPDLVLAFTFFTALTYSVVGTRFTRQRPAIALSVSGGLALAIGLIGWEQANGYSIRDLGPLAIGFALLVLALVIYQALRKVGGSWAGAAITLGMVILVAQFFQAGVLVDPAILETITVVALIVGLLAFLGHPHRSETDYAPRQARASDLRPDLADLYRQRQLSNRLANEMKTLRKEADLVTDRPEQTEDILRQLQRMLPAEGYLTKRLAQLRTKAHRIRNGHIARLEETQHAFANLPASDKKRAAAQMTDEYQRLVGIDTRLERLDHAVAETERRIRDLTGRAQRYAARYDYRHLADALHQAQKLQQHNSRLFKTIERTEKKLTAIATAIAQQANNRLQE